MKRQVSTLLLVFFPVQPEAGGNHQMHYDGSPVLHGVMVVGKVQMHMSQNPKRYSHLLTIPD